MSFVENGFVDMGRVIDKKDCEAALRGLRANRPWGPELFLSEADFRYNPTLVGVNPRPGRNALEHMDLDFVENNYAIKEYVRAILGPVSTVLCKKAVAAIPAEWLPDWVKQEIKERPVPNLGAYIKPEYRDITYFHGIDWHQDIIDYPERKADFITLYVYLDKVTVDDSPLQVILRSHERGAQVFPHNLKDYGELETRVLTGPPGTAYLWHSCLLHGTQPSASVANRISLRYVIAKQGANGYLLDEVNEEIEGPLSLAATRRDLDKTGKSILKGNTINES